MQIINLKLQGKQAIGDGTKIVCMNSDYVVQVDCSDCDDFVNLPIKKLVIKSGTEYQEAPIENKNGTLQASLPLFDCQKTVELGVYGKQSEDADPVYTSKSALFECEKSILCGTVVLKGDPKLEQLEVTKNGTYLASEKNVDGFFQVDVAVGDKPSEERTVELSMVSGSQVVEPSSSERTMSKVTITKPFALTPENIRAGQSIGGVVGTYDKVLTGTEIYADGEYVPPEGYDGFSSVVVNVGNTNFSKILRIGDYFSYDYDTSVNITMDTTGIVKYENDGNNIIFTAMNIGNCSVVLKDFDASGAVVKTVHYAIEVYNEDDYMLPVEAKTAEEMNAYLTNGANEGKFVGSVIKYTGNNDSVNGFVKNAIYIIVEGDSE